MYNQAAFQAQELHAAELRRICREALEAARTAQLELVNLHYSRSLLNMELIAERSDHRLTRAMRPLVGRRGRGRRQNRRLTSASSRSSHGSLSATTESPPSENESEATLADPTYEDMIRQVALLDEIVAEEAPVLKIEPKEEPADEGYAASA